MALEGITDEAQLLSALTTGPAWRIVEVAQSGLAPKPGLYTLWAEDRFLYVGIAYRDPAETSNRQARGVPGRLGTYAAARLTSDLTIAILTRFVLPVLTPEELAAYGTGQLRVRDLQARTRHWIHEHITFRAGLCDGATARKLETRIRRDGLPGVGPPLFNGSGTSTM